MLLASIKEIQTIADHFLIAAIWADAPEGSHPRATKSALHAAYRLASDFVSFIGLPLFRETLEAYENHGLHPDCNGSPCAAFGHDLYLTMAGHGAGFWDREALACIVYDHGARVMLGAYLTKHCRGFTGSEGLHSLAFYRGWVYFSGN